MVMIGNEAAGYWVRADGPYEESVEVDPTWSRLAEPPGYMALQTVAEGAHGLEAGQVYLDLALGKRRLVRQ